MSDLIKMVCINNVNYENCLTVGKVYDVEMESISTGTMYKVIDDNGEFLQTMVDRFKE